MGCHSLHGIKGTSLIRIFGESDSLLNQCFWEKGVVAGMIGLLPHSPLLLTSIIFSVRFLGGRAWKQLHRLTYPAFFFIVFFWASWERPLNQSFPQAFLLMVPVDREI